MKRKREREREIQLIFVKLMGPILFNLLTKMSPNNIVCILKTDMRSFLNSVFKHPKMNNITQTLLKKNPTKHVFFFFGTVFSI